MSILSCHDCGVTAGHPHYRHCSDYTGDVPYFPTETVILRGADGTVQGASSMQHMDDPYKTRNMKLNELAYPAPEVRITSDTGGQKGQKLAQLGALDPQALLEVAKVAGFGGIKYDRYNFLKGYDWSLCFDALQRHALAFWGGEDLDPESGLPHLAHAAWHCLALLAFSARDLGTDDRYKEPS